MENIDQKQNKGWYSVLDHACNLSIAEVEAGRLGVLVSLGYTASSEDSLCSVRPCMQVHTHKEKRMQNVYTTNWWGTILYSVKYVLNKY